jgi:acetylornithine deacetylase/succinyl-diaminopimelate desuccinylase-like protein
MLLAHMDVVGVERQRWTTNPFGGELLDGYLYGRGAIDDKGMLAVNLQTMLMLQERLANDAPQPDRDLVFLATGDEETGGTLGIGWLVNERPELLEAEYALNEGGRLREEGGRIRYCAVQCAEKTSHLLYLRAYGGSGHASLPRSDNAIVRLARALARLAAHLEPLQLSEVTRRFFAGLAAVSEGASEREAFANLASGISERERRGAALLATRPELEALARNTVAATMISGGARANVVPAEATAVLNVRTLPGVALEEVVARLRAVVEDNGVELVVAERGRDAPATSPDSAMFAAIAAVLEELAPGVPVLPYLSTGATDSAALRRLGVAAYGLLPFPLSAEDESRMHGHDERLAVAALAFAIRLEWGIVARLLWE